MLTDETEYVHKLCSHYNFDQLFLPSIYNLQQLCSSCSINKPEQLIDHIPFESHILLHASRDKFRIAYLKCRLGLSFQESVPGLQPLVHSRKGRVLVDELLGCSNTIMIPARNSASKPIDKVLEFSIWDDAINPC